MRSSRFVVSCLALLGAGCGSDGSSSGSLNTCPLPRDGTRLKAIRIQAEDGASEDRSGSRYWYDSQLGTYCAFETAADDVLRCLPRVGPPWFNLFSDAACSQRVAYGPRCLAEPPYVTAPLQTACAGGEDIYPSAVYRLGPGSVPGVLYREETDSAGNVTCAATPNSEGRQAFPLLVEVPPTTFVAATIERAAGPRIQPSEIAAADGARGRDYTFPFDSTFGTACDVALAADGEWRCLPLDAIRYLPSRFADTMCTQGLVAKPDRSCDPAFTPTYGGIEEQRTCAVLEGGSIFTFPPKLHVHQLDPPTTPADVFQKTYGAGDSAICEGGPNVEAQQYSRVRAELAPTEFARADVKEVACGPLGASGRRLQAHHRVFEDGTPSPRSSFGAWVDAQTGQACSFNVAVDDVLRCLPTGQLYVPEAQHYFADAACKQTLVSVSRCTDQPLGPPQFAVSDEPLDNCGAGRYADFRRRVRTLGAAVTPSVLYAYDATQTPARCVPSDQVDFMPLAAILQIYDFHPLGSEVPPATFVAGSFTTP
jgi:hypothetical protein